MSTASAARPKRSRWLAPDISAARIRHHLRASAGMILLVSAIVLAGEYFGWFDQFEKGATDWLARQRGFESIAKEIVVVGIGEDQYLTTFKNTSPLPSEPLKNILQKLANACPAVIGIDVVNGPRLDQPAAGCETPPRLIYAATAQRTDVAQGHAAGPWKWFWGGEMAEIELEGPMPDRSEEAGLPVFPMDRDGAVRSYARKVRAVFTEPRQSREMDSLNAALVKGYCEVINERRIKEPGPPGCRGYEAGAETFLFGRWGQNHIVPLDVSEVLRKGFDKASGSLHNKIILLGGKFSASRDSYATPNGTYYGVDLLALAVDSDLHRYGISEVEPWLALSFDFAIGISIVMLFALFRPVPAFWISFAGTFFLSVGFSAFLFHKRSYALNFMVVGMGIIIHQLFVELEKVKELDEAEVRIEALEADVKALRSGSAEG